MALKRLGEAEYETLRLLWEGCGRGEKDRMMTAQQVARKGFSAWRAPRVTEAVRKRLERLCQKGYAARLGDQYVPNYRACDALHAWCDLCDSPCSSEKRRMVAELTWE